MTTVALIAQLMPRVGDVEFTELGADKAALVAAATHGGVQAFFAAVPSVYRQTTVTWQARPPRDLSLDVVDGSPEVVGEPFAARERGATLTVDGDPFPHEVAGPGRLARSYDGPTGERSARLFGDAIPVSHVYVEQVIGDIRVFRPGQDRGAVITPVDLDSLGILPTLGEPRHYALQPVGMTHVVDAGWMLRLRPAPAAVMQIRFRAQLFPPPVTLASCLDPLPLPVRHADEHLLVAICAGLLAEGPAWGGDASSRGRAQHARDTALHNARSLSAYLTTPNHAIGIP